MTFYLHGQSASLARGGENCVCGGYSDRFPDSTYQCRCYTDNPACLCWPSREDDSHWHIEPTCPAHGRGDA